MNFEFIFSIFTAFWVGIITSISPYPLATNISALTYISKHSKFSVILNGFMYSLGRSFTYVIIAFLLVKSLINAPSFSFFIQKYGNQLISILLILADMYMLDMFSINGINLIDTSKLKFSGFAGSFFMGLVFALAFCPISAALYFGTVIPLSINNSSPFIIPFLYGLGTAIPIIIIAILIEFGFKKISLITKFIGRFEKKLNNLTAYVFIISGIYLALKYIFEII